MSGILCHHGVKGQKWGVRRYRNRDGTLTAEGVIHQRMLNAAKTKSAVDNIYNSMSKRDKYLLGDEEELSEFLTIDEGEYVVKRFLDKDGNTPVAFLDILATTKSDTFTVAVGTNPSYRGQGRAARLTRRGQRWFDKNADKYGAKNLDWGARVENTASRRLAEKSGFVYDPSESNEEWAAYRYSKKGSNKDV